MHGGQRVGDGQAQVVVAVRRDDHPLDPAHLLPDAGDQLRKLGGHGVAHSIGDVDRRGSGLDHGLQDFAEKVRVRASGIFGGKLHVIAERFGQAHGVARLLETFAPRDS